MKRRAYYIQKLDGTLVEKGGVAIPFKTLDEARAKAREVMGYIGYWNWIHGRFEHRRRG